MSVEIESEIGKQEKENEKIDEIIEKEDDSLLKKAEKAAERMEKATEKFEKLLVKEERLAVERTLAGSSSAGTKRRSKEEIEIDNARKFLEGTGYEDELFPVK